MSNPSFILESGGPTPTHQEWFEYAISMRKHLDCINEFVMNVKGNINLYLNFFKDVSGCKMTKERLGTFLGFALGTGSDLLESEIFTKTNDDDLLVSMRTLVHYYASLMQEKLPKIHEYMKKNEGRLSKSDAVYCGMMGICWNQKTKETELWDQFTPEIIPNVLMEMEHILKARKKMHSKIVFYVAFNALKKTLQVLGRIEIPKHPTPRKAKTTMVLPTRDKNKKKSFLKAGVIDWDQVWEYQLGCASFKDAVVLSDNTTNPHLLYAVSVAYPRVARFLQKTGLPYDILFDSGREARRLSNLPVLPSVKPVGLKSSCTPLLTPKKQTELKNILKGRAPNFLVVSPMVVDVANCYTPEYKEAILQVMDSVPFVTDRGGSGTLLLRASFLRRTEKADKYLDSFKLSMRETRGTFPQIHCS